MDFVLTEKQAPYFRAVFQLDGRNVFNEFPFFGGFGCGKSFIIMLCTAYLCANYPGMEWLFIRATYGELHDSVIPQFLNLFPPDVLGYRYMKNDRLMKFNNGSVLYMRAFDTDSKVLSNQYHGASLCQAEEIPETLKNQLWGRLRYKHPNFDKNIMLLEGNPAPGWAKKRYKDNPLPDNVYFVEATTHENQINLPTDYITNMMNQFPESMIRRYIYSEWETFEDMVFSDFKEAINVIEPFPMKKWYFSAIGCDYGWRHPTVILWGSVDEHGNIIIWDEFYETECHFERIGEEGKRNGVIPFVLDYATKRPDRDGKSVWTELSAMGLPLIESMKDELRDIVKMNQMFKNCKLYIQRNCVNLIREIKEAKWKRRKQEDGIKIKEEIVDKDNDAVDALRYLVAYIEDIKSKDPDAFDYTKSIDFMTKRYSNTENHSVYIGR